MRESGGAGTWEYLAARTWMWERKGTDCATNLESCEARTEFSALELEGFYFLQKRALNRKRGVVKSPGKGDHS